MSLKRVVLVLLVIGFYLSLSAQYEQISGTVNDYFKVENVNPGFVQLAAGTLLTGRLQPGDKVVLMQMSGVNVDDSDVTDVSPVLNWGDAGNYELLAVSAVDDDLDQVSFTVTLDDSKYTSGEKIQLVKIYEADYAELTGNVTASDWDGEIGGIVAMVIFKKLRLSGGNIDVSGQGFRGGAPELNYTHGCRSFSPVIDTANYTAAQINRAGGKGEGNVSTSFIYTHGPGWTVSGGGGGTGYLSGGGGGGNYGEGGLGGRQGQFCGVVPTKIASGGIDFGGGTFYLSNRITMGGGGGSSTATASYSTTDGGKGGGIIIIIADTIEGNNRGLLAEGEAISGNVEGGGAGGGAGGSILLDVNYFENDLNISVAGGDGGSTGTHITGSGGGGGGGICWYAGESLSASVDVDASPGVTGDAALIEYTGFDGGSGNAVSDLKLPLNGFLFNSLQGTDTICQFQQPMQINASMPKGGETAYTYTWLQSSDGNNWSVIAAATDSLFYQPPVLTQTTYYTRVVESGGIQDTALQVEVFVYNAIVNNDLAIRDTLCYNDGPGVLTTLPLSGGDGIYNYLWETSVDQVLWNIAGTDETLIQNSLQETTYYRRSASSANGVCTDISNIDTISVLPLITGNNFIPADTSICSGLDAGIIQSGALGGGQEGAYTHQWISSDDNLSYSIIPGAITETYSPGILTDSSFYKRIIFSGSDDACIDTSNAYLIAVLPELSAFNISSPATLYCAGDSLQQISGENIQGGDGVNYLYTWQWRQPGDTWATIPGEESADFNPPLMLEDTFQLQRIVASGVGGECVEQSNIIQIDVIPYINNELVSSNENICEAAIPLPFTETEASGGNGIFDYLWQSQTTSGGVWEDAALPNDQVSYSSGPLSETTLFRRKVNSSICTHYSDTITIVVYPSISDNIIDEGSLQYTCFNTSKDILASTPTGGRPDQPYEFIWQQSLESSTWSGAAGTNNTEDYATPVLTDTIFYRRIVLSGETQQCKDTTEAVLIRINSLPSGDIISKIDTACVGAGISISYVDFAGNAPWSLHLGVSEATTTRTGLTAVSGTVEFIAVESGPVKILDLTDVNGCHADLSSSDSEVDLRVYEYPDTDAGDDTEVCGQEYSMDAASSGELGFWSGTPGLFSDPTSPISLLTVPAIDESVQYTYVWTELNWECQSADSVALTFYEVPEYPNLGEDIYLDYSFSVTLSAPEHVGTGLWEQLAGPENGTAEFDSPTENITDVSFTPFVTGNYSLQWTVINGVCDPISDDVLIEIGKKLLYKAFSPNGDGVNDEFIINLSGIGSATLIIIDRTGNEVYRQTDEMQLIWDGKNADNQEMPEGTYFYILTEESRPGVVDKKYIELRR